MTRPQRFFCVGDIDVDMLIQVAALPGLDQKTQGNLIDRAPGGMAANVAAGLARLGAPAGMVSAVGDDTDGSFALAALEREGVDVSQVRRMANTGTFICIVFLTPGGEKSLIRLPTAAYGPSPDAIDGLDLGPTSFLHTTFGEPAVVERVLRIAPAAGCPVSMDLEEADMPEDPTLVRRALETVDLLFINARTQDRLKAMGLLDLRNDRETVVTQGRRGALYRRGGKEIFAAGHAVDAVDTTGAGDAFAAAFLFSHRFRGETIEASLRFANAAAALSTTAIGAQSALPRSREIEALLNDQIEAGVTS